jgi:regulator of protease activity HflC (stomatin/prohibitin superfamily)
MAVDDPTAQPSPIDITQLAQVRVPLEDAGAAFETRDASGRTPIVLVPLRNLRIRFDLLGGAAGLVILGSVATALGWNAALSMLCFALAIVLCGVGLMSAFFVRVPEGTTALLVSGGRHLGVLGPGPHVVPPWIVVSHVVTRRQIPFALPRVVAPTHDNVSASIDALATFSIADPARFVYSIAVPDFDLVLQATCAQATRSLIRGESWSSVLDLSADQAATLRLAIDTDVRAYGVQIDHLNITHARPDPAFMQAEEGRQLAVVQRAEQAERQTLAEHRQHDQDALFDLRLSHLEEALGRYPHAANWEWQGAQLDVVRALASNGRAVVQLGRPADVLSALLLHLAGDTPAANGDAPPVNPPPPPQEQRS